MSIAQIREAYTEYKISSVKREDIVEKLMRLANDDGVEFLQSKYGFYHIDTKAPLIWQDWEQLLLRIFFESTKKRRGLFDIKKDLKTCKSAAICYRNAWKKRCQQYIIANKQKQSASRAFEFICNSIEMNPYVSRIVEIAYSRSKITFPNGSTIEALPQDAEGEAGADPYCVIFDEVWGFSGARNYNMVEEFTIPPSQPDGFQFFTSYAGYDISSRILKDIYDDFFDEEENLLPGIIDRTQTINWQNKDYRATQLPVYENESTIIYWSNGPLNNHPGQPHHTRAYFDDQRRTLRSKKFLQLHENRWTTGSDDGVFEESWNACKRNSLTIITTEDGKKAAYKVPENLPDNVPLYVGIDGATKNDHAVVVSIYPYPKIENMVALGPWKIWRPEKDRPINLDEMEEWLYWLNSRFWIKKMAYDPTQLFQMMTRVARAIGSHRVIEFTQSTNNLMLAADALFTMLKYVSFIIPQNERLDWYAYNAVGKETNSGGWYIKKDEGKKKIDFIVALSFACYFIVKEMHLFKNMSPSMQSPRDRMLLRKAQEEEKQFAASIGSHVVDTGNLYGDLQDSLDYLEGSM